MSGDGNRFGATPEEWRRLVALGLTEDLLPVVSNPNNKIHPSSRLKKLGKTPSKYDSPDSPHRMVVGLPGWTRIKAVAEQIERCIAQPDYGACIQTRIVRAFDVDIESELAVEVYSFIEDWCISQLVRLPCRSRRGNLKFLMCARIPGELPKRTIYLKNGEKGIIEFLGTGQQFVAFGTHESGERYDWGNTLDDGIPDLTVEQLNDLWSKLLDKFGDSSITARVSSTGRAAVLTNAAAQDPVAQHLLTHDWVKSRNPDQSLNIRCPFENEHSDGGLTPNDRGSDTTYFIAHTGGYARGHFKCLHAHCANRTDADFRSGVGIVPEEFEVLPPVLNSGDHPKSGDTSITVLASLTRTRNGDVEGTMANVKAVIDCPECTGVRFGLDGFRDELMLQRAQPGDKGDHWSPCTDSTYTALRILLERRVGMKKVTKELIRDAVRFVGERNQFDSGIKWLNALKWDGVDRIERFFIHYFGAEDTPYIRAVGRYMWTALAGRLLEPGCQADMVPVLVGPQGTGKSRGVAAIAPSPELFVELTLDTHDADFARRIRGKVIGEISELRGLGTRDLESIKALVTRTHEHWVPKYMEFSTTFARRLVLVGTTNGEEFLSDPTGERRWLPIEILRGEVEAIARDRELLWAEAAVVWGIVGVDWRDAQSLAPGVQGDYVVEDPWEHAIEGWLERAASEFDEAGVKNGDRPFRAAQVLAGIGGDVVRFSKREEKRVVRALVRLGYVGVRSRVSGRRARYWAKRELCYFEGASWKLK